MLREAQKSAIWLVAPVERSDIRGKDPVFLEVPELSSILRFTIGNPIELPKTSLNEMRRDRRHDEGKGRDERDG